VKTKGRTVRAPIKMPGGKFYLAKRIVALMPAHTLYLEPYLGSGAVLLNRPPALREVAGDIDAGLIGLWRVIRDQPDSLLRLLAGIRYTQAYFNWAAIEDPDHNAVYRAAKYLIRSRFSRGGLRKEFAWSERLRGGQPGDANGWDTIRAELPAIAERVREVEFACDPALDLIARLDCKGSLTYCDPPYVQSTRTATNIYRYEMSDNDHRILLETLRGCVGKVMISGYRSSLYDDALAGWTRHDFSIANHAGQGKIKNRRCESVWVNF